MPPARIERWFENFASRHGRTDVSVGDGRVVVSAADGSVAVAALPLGQEYGGPPDLPAFAEAARVPRHWAVLLVRKGGFAVAAVRGTEVLDSKVGQRHVQGRTKAGGQSQQRFARRRDNQARAAYEAAAEHAQRILAGRAVDALVCGGDRQAVEQVLADARLAPLRGLRVEPWLAVPDPRRAVLDRAVLDGASVHIDLTDPADPALVPR